MDVSSRATGGARVHARAWDSPGGCRRRRPLLLLILSLLLVALLAPAARASAATVVSLTFDDGRQTQYAAKDLLAAHGMQGTFYVNSGLVGSSTSDWHMTWTQLHDLANAGNEITGHSLTHEHLTTLSSTDLQHQICDDRANLLSQGFSPVISFAYPYAEYDSTVESMVQQCGYTSARWVGGIRASNCSDCPFAETIPPLDRWVLRTPPDIDSGTTLATMEGYVTQAETNGGGWVIIVIHSVCDNSCDSLSVSPSQLTAFLDWLQPRAANGTFVQTVGDVMRGVAPPPPPPPAADTTPPVTTITCNGTTCSRNPYRSAVTVTLSATDPDSPVASTRYTTDGTDPTATNGTPYTGAFTVLTTKTVKYRSWDNAGNVEAVKSAQIKIRH